jgi:HAMP domain-containing protein
LVVITIIGNALQFSRTFMAYQEEQFQDQVQLSAERASGQLENAVESWRSQLAVALPTLRAADAKATSEQLQRFVDASPEFLALELLEAPASGKGRFTSLGYAFTSAASDARFEDKVAAKVRTSLQVGSRVWLKKVAPKAAKGAVKIASLAKGTGLPTMAVAVRFDVAGSPAAVWALLSVWQTNIIKGLPKSRFIDSAVVDAKGVIFASPNVVDMVSRKKFGGAPLLKAALAGVAPSGFEPGYKDGQGRRRLGAFARLPKYGVTVLVEQDADVAYQALYKNLLTTALVAILFILFAAPFAYAGAAGTTKTLRAVAHATSKIASGDFRHEIQVSSRDEVGNLAHDVNHMSKKILALIESQVQKARFEQEI